MKVEIEYDLGHTGSQAIFDLFFDKDTAISHPDATYISMDLGRLECCNAFEHVLIRKLISIWGFKSATLVSGDRLTIIFKDMIVDKNQQLIVADNGWNEIHKSLVQAVRDYFDYVKINAEIIFCDDYPEDFILEGGPLTNEEMEELESFQSESES